MITKMIIRMLKAFVGVTCGLHERVGRGRRFIGVAAFAVVVNGSTAQAQYSVLHSFTGGTDGASPQYGAPVVSGSTVYGTAGAGGTGNNGVVFSVKADGSGFAVLHTFTGVSPDGSKPYGSVSLSGSTLYGTTYGGGASANGAVFKVQTDGSGYQTLYSFTTSGGYKPYSTVTRSGAKLYGTTYYSNGGGLGAVYSVGTNGTGYTTLHNFFGGVSDGSRPMGGALVADGATLYGAALHGGPASGVNDGVVFSVNTNGTYSNLAILTGGTTNGANPYGSVARKGAKLYGTARLGGHANAGTIFSVNTNGTGYTTLYSFSGGTTNAANPYCTPLVDGNVIYGTTRLGGTNNLGTLFKINTDGSDFRILYHFSSEKGSEPSGDLTLSNNTLYGYTLKGGANNVGTIFALAVGEPGYAFQGTGLATVLKGGVNNGALASVTVPAWINLYQPDMPYTLDTGIALPACDRIVAGRVAVTVWGGTADYICKMTVSVNGVVVPSANPFVFGTKAYSNSLYNAEAPRAYGSGYGVWLVTIPVPTDMLHTDGTPNAVRVVEDTPDYFDGRINHVTLTAVYQSAALANVFDYTISEGEGLINSYPVSPQVDRRTVSLGAVGTNDVFAANMSVLYTYGSTWQYDELFFNGVQLGGDDVAQWDISELDYGPSVVSFDVTDYLSVTNSVIFDVTADDVGDPPEGSVRPQLVTLCITRAPLALRNVSISGEEGFSFGWSASSVNTYTVEYSTDLTNPNGWTPLPGYSNVTGADGLMNCVDPSGGPTRFYRLIRH